MKIKFSFDDLNKANEVLNVHFTYDDNINTEADLYRLAYSLWLNQNGLIGKSTRTNQGQAQPCIIVWAMYRGKDYQLVVDGADPSIIVSIFPLTPKLLTRYHRMQNYAMQPR